MMQTVNYLVDDIEIFLEINAIEDEKEHSKSLKKLLNVRDKIAIFKNIDIVDLKAIVYDVKFIKYKFKDYVITQGDKSESIFFIINGKCQVFHNKQRVGYLKAGEIFGESGVIFKTKRNASVVCSSDEVILLSFCIDEDNMEFCAEALATLYKNLALEINSKLEVINAYYIKK